MSSLQANHTTITERNLMKRLPIEIENIIWQMHYMDIFKNQVLNELLEKIKAIYSIEKNENLLRIIRKQRFETYGANYQEKLEFQNNCKLQNNIILDIISCKTCKILVKYLQIPFYNYLFQILKWGQDNIFPCFHNDFKLICMYYIRRVSYSEKMEKILIDLLPKID